MQRCRTRAAKDGVSQRTGVRRHSAFDPLYHVSKDIYFILKIVNLYVLQYCRRTVLTFTSQLLLM